MKYILISFFLIIAGVITSCTENGNTLESNEHTLNCVSSGSFLSRCENKEVICYKYISYGLQCRFKGDLK
jgi:hypothetical protein